MTPAAVTPAARERWWPVPAGMAIGFVVDRMLGDPRHWHPVAGFGLLAARLEARTYADSRLSGCVHTVGLVTATAGAAGLLARLTKRGAHLGELLLVSAATWAVLGGRSLEREAAAVAARLDEDDLPAARQRIRSLVGRDPSGLGADELARAVIESVAENTSDAVVAPLFWGAVAGAPGLIGYRALNTLDAMIGHRSPRYRRFGWAAARLDDAANWVPARLSAAIAATAAPAVGGRPAAAVHAVREGAHCHPSPNAGQVEAAFAGALGVRLGGTNTYGDQVEDRGHLGNGPHPTAADIPRSLRLARAVGVGSLAVLVMVRIALAGPPARGRGQRGTSGLLLAEIHERGRDDGLGAGA